MSTVATTGWSLGYDAVDVDHLPPGGIYYYVYVDGLYAASAADIAQLRAEKPYVLTVAIEADTVAHEFDYESGNPDDVVGWLRNMRAGYGYLGVVYANEASIPAVLALCAKVGMSMPYFRVADWTGRLAADVQDYGAGTVAVQTADENWYDIDYIAPNYPVHIPPAGTHQEDDMNTTSVSGRAGLSWPAGTRHVVQVTYDPAPLADFTLRVVLALTTGPWVAPDWTLTYGTGTYEIPTEHIEACRGIILTDDGKSANIPVYDLTAV